MRVRLLLIITMLMGLCDVTAQEEFSSFKLLEKRVKYTNPDSLFIFSEQVDTISQLGKAIRYWAKGRAYYWNSDYPSAYEYMERSLELVKQQKNQKLLGELYLDLSAALAVVDENGKALSYALNAHDLMKEFGNEEQQIRASISLGELYRKIGEYESALKILRQTLPDTRDFSDSRTRCLNRMAAVFSETSKWDSSLYYSYRALEISSALGDPDLIATSENEIGYAYRHSENVERSLDHFFRADSLWRSIGKLRYAASPKHHISIVYRTLERFELALDHSRKTYLLVKGKGWYQIEMNILEDLKMVHHHLGNTDSVLFYDRERLQAAINFRTKQFEVNTKMVEVLYTQKENEQTIREQNIKLKNEALEKEAIIRERTTLWITVSLIVIILLIIFIYAFNQRKLKKRLFIENQSKEKKNEQLLIALGANEALVQEISHRVKNNLAVLAGLLNMQANRSDSDKVKKELKDSVLRIESIATIHKKLYDKRSDAHVNLKDAIEELSSNVVSAMGADPKECLVTELDHIEVDISEAVTLCLIINEAITNSCKYAKLDTNHKLKVQLKVEDTHYVCRVIDQGPGFDENQIDSKTKNLGIYLIKLLAKQLKASIDWRREEVGFVFSIQLVHNE